MDKKLYLKQAFEISTMIVVAFFVFGLVALFIFNKIDGNNLYYILTASVVAWLALFIEDLLRGGFFGN